jgi:radical SAM superfamily enzyme YgiQ (UPF0313 family)
MADIVLINPRFEISYWGLERALPLLGKRANLPVASLPLLAALTPPGHAVTLLDENVEPIDFDRAARADVVGVTGMSVQRFRMREILAELKRRGAFTAVGGPWVTVREDYFGPLADVIFVGEAEETWPVFLREWAAGRPRPRYEQAEKTDMSTVPVPRFDLLKMEHYAFGSVQFSRGCPFQCEFCDIIVTFGRRPRVKSSAQVIAELEALRGRGVRLVFLVDDNLIGNKKAAKALLRDLGAWQRAHGSPLVLFTEASIDLADDPELLRLMADAHIVSVFVGIESPNEASLRETKKFQNVRPGGTLLEKVHRIQAAGLDVWCGMIVGFDHDGPEIFAAQREFLRRARIAHAMVGMLHAIPKTPLHARLEAEGRLDPDDVPAHGTNVVPRRMSRDELRAGYVRLLDELYEPAAYFGRLEDLWLRERAPYRPGRLRYWRTRAWPWNRLTSHAQYLAASLVLFRRLMRGVPDAGLRREYRRRLWRLVRSRPDPALLFNYLIKCAMHYHHHTMAREMARGQGRLVNSF